MLHIIATIATIISIIGILICGWRISSFIKLMVIDSESKNNECHIGITYFSKIIGPENKTINIDIIDLSIMIIASIIISCYIINEYNIDNYLYVFATALLDIILIVIADLMLFVEYSHLGFILLFGYGVGVSLICFCLIYEFDYKIFFISALTLLMLPFLFFLFCWLGLIRSCIFYRIKAIKENSKVKNQRKKEM